MENIELLVYRALLEFQPEAAPDLPLLGKTRTVFSPFLSPVCMQLLLKPQNLRVQVLLTRDFRCSLRQLIMQAAPINISRCIKVGDCRWTFRRLCPCKRKMCVLHFIVTCLIHCPLEIGLTHLKVHVKPRRDPLELEELAWKELGRTSRDGKRTDVLLREATKNEELLCKP